MTPDELIAKWAPSGGAENANAQHFIIDLCDMLGVPRPEPAQEVNARNNYVFERAVRHEERGTVSTNRIDCYKRDCFILESKQSSSKGAKAGDPNQGDLLPEHAGPVKGGMALRGTAAWDRAMRRAYGQAREYVMDLPTDHNAPVFLVVIDVGYMIELYADFSGRGRNYTQFPNRTEFSIPLESLRLDDVRGRLAAIWTNPKTLDPTIRAAEVTRDVAERLGKVASRLEKAHEPAAVAAFLMRCLFTMFAEDVELIPKASFTRLLEELKEDPSRFVPELETLWATMDQGGYAPAIKAALKRFNGSLFKDRTALPLDREGINELWAAAKRQWKDVEPAIFGTMLEKALQPKERAQLGAHYTPRAYVERLVVPTIIEPLRADWETVQAAIAEAVDRAQSLRRAVAEASAKFDPNAARASRRDQESENRRKLNEAVAEEQRALREARAFHHKLCTTRVLDPACGTGNFLYVSLELLKRLEGEVLEVISSLIGEDQNAFAMAGETVDPSQFYGLELNPRAVAIADLVLWLGYLKWQLQNVSAAGIAEPVLHAYGTIREADAVLEYDERQQLLDDNGQPLTRWDGETMKVSPVTGREVPDETARVPVYTYVNPRRATWPEAEFIVGNPPFIGGKHLRHRLGDGYAEALWAVRPYMSGVADFVMQWWDEAALRLTGGGVNGTANPLRRFGFITTNSITQTFSRRLVERHLQGNPPASIVFAVGDHPWVKGADRAAVRISMTVVQLGKHEGLLGRIMREEDLNTDTPVVELDTTTGRITAKLTLGADPAAAVPLLANDSLGNFGMALHGQGFVLEDEWRRRLEPNRRVRPYLKGRDLLNRLTERQVIDLSGMSEADVRSEEPEIFSYLFDHIKPERDANARKTIRENWWIYGWDRPVLRASIQGQKRFIGTTETSKHRLFHLLRAAVVPDHAIIAISLASGEGLAFLSSRIHTGWTIAAGGWLGVGNDSRYNKTRTFDPFPFPGLLTDTEPDPHARALKDRLGDLGERLDAFRKERIAAHDDLTMTGIYNRLERRREALAGGEPLSEMEREDHTRAQTALLAEIHDDIDRATLAAYGWDDLALALVGKPGGTTPSTHKDEAQEAAEEEMLSRLVALNAERAKEEARGLVRWLRPDYQIPKLGHKVAKPADAEKAEIEMVLAAAPDPRPWPADARDQFAAVRTLLDATPEPMPAEAVARAFSGRLTSKRRERIDEVLTILADLGTIRAGQREGQTLFFTRR